MTLAFGAVSQDWLPISPHMPGCHVIAYLAGALLVAGGLAINIDRAARFAALGLAALFAVGMLVFEAPSMATHLANWGGWQAVAESTVMALGGVLAYARSPGAGDSASLARLARLVFGLCLLVFGGSHFIYAKFTASMVPAWLPPSQLIWAYATGAAQIAAGLAVLSGVQARLAAILLTVMYAAFGLLVHLPTIISAPGSHDNWTENGINLVLTGAAWCLTDALARAKKGKSASAS
ncbi:MAG TPA: DoxX family protein [Caulobacteraceae bacterium]|nr:DoxX family protein [Caulobacteraceae bacterium]